MNREQIKVKLEKSFKIAPKLTKILASRKSITEKRRRLRKFLSDQLFTIFDDNPAIPPLEWILTRDAIQTFRNILSQRSERIAGFSLLKYLNDLLHKNDLREIGKPSEGFFAEIDHLLRGVMGKTKVYSEKIPTFLKYEGEKAAKMRSTDLSAMARTSLKYMDQYPSGLEHETIQKRNLNKSRILDYFGANDQDWTNWKWHVRHIIRDVNTLKSLINLTEEEYEGVTLAKKYKIPFGITPYYISLMDHNLSRKKDYAIRAQVIPPPNYVLKMKKARDFAQSPMDFMLERNTSPIEGITRRYPMIAILKPVIACPQICVYCQRNWEIEDVNSPNAAISSEKLDKAIQWIANTPELREILITGGDPLLLSDDKLERLLSKISRIKHIKRIRIGTRIPVTMPQRLTDSLVNKINRFHQPGKREIIIITHFEHPYEITPQATEAVQKFKKCGIDVFNQLVFTFYNSKKYEVSALRQLLRSIGVTPYYTFNTKGKEETDDYRVPIARLLQEQEEEARLLPGSIRTDKIVFNVPGLGKNHLGASQHHDVISILPDGRRVHEFHPWEKKLSLIDTYVYTDVSIYNYLERLKQNGENPALYRTIWYYY